MPTLVPYPQVVETLARVGLRSVYYNGGVFGWARNITPQVRGWLSGDDSTVLPAVRDATTVLPIEQIAEGLCVAWRELFPGPLWLMPGSHWGYELDYGSHEWLGSLLETLSIDPALLKPLTRAEALAFSPSEHESARKTITALLNRLSGSSDFSVAFTGWPVTCLIHHHHQIWWTFDDPALLARLAAIA